MFLFPGLEPRVVGWGPCFSMDDWKEGRKRADGMYVSVKFEFECV